jgi:hypothetical protein
MIKFDGVRVTLRLEKDKTILYKGMTCAALCTKKSLQEVVQWLISEYTKDASATYKKFGRLRSFGPILLKDLLNAGHDVEFVEVRSAFYPPDQVKFNYRCNLWIEHANTTLDIFASEIPSPSEPVLCGIRVSLLAVTLQQQQSVLQWLIKSYTKYASCYYRVGHVNLAGHYHTSVRLATSNGKKQATLEEIFQSQLGSLGEVFLPVDHLPYTNEYSYLASIKLQHSTAEIRVQGTIPPIYDDYLEDNDDNSNSNNNDNSTDNDNKEPEENLIEDEEEQFAQRGGGDDGDNDDNNNGYMNDDNHYNVDG